MPFDGNGLFSPAAPEYPAVSGTTILADDWNTIVEDLAQGLSNTITRDGQSPAQANLPMGGFKLTGLAPGTANGNSLRWEQVFGLGGFIAPNGTTATTQPYGDSTNKLATTAFVHGMLLTVSDVAPAAPANGQPWLNTANGRYYTYINDGTSSQWVEFGSLTYLTDPANVASVAALRGYAGGFKTMRISGYNSAGAPFAVAGDYAKDPLDAGTADDGLNVIVDALGKRWKLQRSPVYRLNGAQVWSSAGTIRVVSNAYFSGAGWKYENNGAASCVEHSGGITIFYTAVAGLAEGAVAWVEVARLDANKHWVPGGAAQDTGLTGTRWRDGYYSGVVYALAHQSDPVAFAALPAAAAGNKGQRRFITDSNLAFAAANFGAVAAAGGANNVPVTSDGTNWRIG